MRSMTGYGRGQAGTAGLIFIVEVNTVNRRQLDIAVNALPGLAGQEALIRGCVAKHVSRGRVQVSIQCVADGTAESGVSMVDRELARRFYREASELARDLGLGSELSLESVLRAPGVTRSVEMSVNGERAWPAVERALVESLKAMCEMRENEGANLAEDLTNRFAWIGGELDEMEPQIPQVVTRHREQLHERLARAGCDIPLDDDRVLREIALYAERCDISEEMTRIRSHLAQLAETLGSDEPVGRRLEFLIQEIQRELNTMGSKAGGTDITARVVGCKVELEKIREQIQNVE